MLLMVINTCFTNEESQAATSANDAEIDENNLTNILFQSFSDNIKPCEMYNNLDEQTFDIGVSSYLFLHLNICSL